MNDKFVLKAKTRNDTSIQEQDLVYMNTPDDNNSENGSENGGNLQQVEAHSPSPLDQPQESRQTIRCAACSGLGGSSKNPCDVCGGIGQVDVRTPYTMCTLCMGYGGSSRNPCKICHGIGVVSASSRKVY